jgi:hypothetical protein
MAADVKIDIAAEFTGKKAFRQAETATDKMSKNVKKLAGALGLAFGGQQLLAFGKASIKAAAADQKAQQQLALALKNVGLGRDAATSEAYIQRLQSEFGIVDDLLRPSYQTLAIATRDSAEAQRLMNIALDVSAANSLDLNSVTKALSRAYLGNNTALSRLQVGISKADLQTKSFKEITDQLSRTFAGSATTAASGYQGSMDRLTVATENFKESIGVGLLEALNILNGEQGLAKTTSEMDKLGIKLQNATIGAAYFVDEFKKIPVIGSYLTSLFGKTIGDPLGIRTLINAFEKLKQEPRPFTTPMTISGQTTSPSTGTSSPNRAAQVAATKAAQAQVKATKELTKSTKDQLKIAKAKAIFDIQKIQIQAALQGKISEEERIRLMLLKAIIEENIDDIEKYTRLLNEIQGKVVDLQETLEEVYAMDAGNPFIAWEIGLDGVQRAIIEINKQSIELTSTIAQNSLAMGLLGGASFAQALSGARYAAQAAASMGITGTIGSLPPAGGAGGTGGAGGDTNVTVIVQGTLTTEQELKQSIVDAMNSSALTGNLAVTSQPDRLVAI